MKIVIYLITTIKMNSEQIRLINILKTNKELKERIEKPVMWKKLYRKIWDTYTKDVFTIENIREWYWFTSLWAYWEKNKNDAIILEATMVDLLYFLNNESDFLYYTDSEDIMRDNWDEWISIILCLDFWKELLEQDEKVLKQLNDWLEKEFLNTK